MSKWQRLSGKVVYQNNYLSVHEDQVIAPDGRATTYGWIGTPPAVFMVAMNDADEVCLVQQERYTSGLLSWEVPAGSTYGEADLVAAQRELAEEARLHADHWERLPHETYPFGSLAAERNTVFIATGLHAVKSEKPPTDDVITAVRWVSWKKLKELIQSGEISNGQTITTLTLAGFHLGRIK
jgi:8-oxo-dGTP pyrophosphatase MutT (NUDIX family)